MAELSIDISDTAFKAIEQIKADGYTVHRWIPCKERLPEKDTSVLICGAGHRVTAYYDAVKGVFRLTESDDLFYLASAVTHWMPLPDVPQTEEDESDG